MLNWSLLTPRNFLVIGGMAIVAHLLIKPVYSLIQGKGN